MKRNSKNVHRDRASLYLAALFAGTILALTHHLPAHAAMENPETGETCRGADCEGFSDPPASGSGSSNSTLGLDEVIDCNDTQSKDVKAVAWNIADDWSKFESWVENETGKKLGNCIKKRFSTNGKIECVSNYNCNNKGCKLAFAPGLKKRIKIYKTFFDNIAGMPQADRRACFAGLMAHEFSHSCENYGDGANSAAELREDAVFDYWKDRFPVSSALSANADPEDSTVPNCGFD